MKRTILFVAALFFLSLVTVSVCDASEMDTAKGMVEKAVTYVKANGKEKSLAELSNPKGQFIKGDIYVFAYDPTMTVVAHPINAKLIGKALLDVPDADGKLFRKEILETAKTKGSGWVDYKYKNPQSNKVETKTTYVKKEGDLIICAGAYKK
jgi:cytochrome c